jgi:Family of unknown function (DUF6544)
MTLTQVLGRSWTDRTPAGSWPRRAATSIAVGFGTGTGLGWLGLQVRPAPFPVYARSTAPADTVPLPAGLPPPVERYYRQLYGEHVLRITSAVLTGRGSARPVGPLTFPMRFRFVHQAGQAFRSYIELTAFGVPIMKVNETFRHGRGWGQTPFGVEEGEQIDQGANLRLWAESLTFLPSILLTDPRVRWAPVDNATALLAVPGGRRPSGSWCVSSRRPADSSSWRRCATRARLVARRFGSTRSGAGPRSADSRSRLAGARPGLMTADPGPSSRWRTRPTTLRCRPTSSHPVSEGP